MEFPSHSFLLFSLLTLSLMNFHASFPTNAARVPQAPAPISNKLIAEVCNDIQSGRARCLAIFGGIPGASSAKDYVELSRFFLEYAIDKATEGQNKIKQILETNKATAIEECAHFDYEGTVDSLKSAMQELVEDPMTANYDASVAQDGPTDCQRGLTQAKIKNPSISSINEEVGFLCAIASEVTDKISTENNMIHMGQAVE